MDNKQSNFLRNTVIVTITSFMIVGIIGAIFLNKKSINDIQKEKIELKVNTPDNNNFFKEIAEKKIISSNTANFETTTKEKLHEKVNELKNDLKETLDKTSEVFSQDSLIDNQKHIKRKIAIAKEQIENAKQKGKSAIDQLSKNEQALLDSIKKEKSAKIVAKSLAEEKAIKAQQEVHQANKELQKTFNKEDEATHEAYEALKNTQEMLNAATKVVTKEMQQALDSEKRSKDLPVIEKKITVAKPKTEVAKKNEIHSNDSQAMSDDDFEQFLLNQK